MYKSPVVPLLGKNRILWIARCLSGLNGASVLWHVALERDTGAEPTQTRRGLTSWHAMRYSLNKTCVMLQKQYAGKSLHSFQF